MKLIVAVDKNYGIGCDNDLLFKLKGDMDFFKATTKDETLIMGSRTLLSIPETSKGEILPGRNKLVFSKREDIQEYYASHKDIYFADELTSQLLCCHKDSMVIGGGAIYELFAPHITEMYITHIDAEAPQVEVYFPESLRPDDSWTATELVSKTEKGTKYRIVKYTRPEAPRVVQELTLAGWLDIKIKDLRVGQVFRMFEADGKLPVISRVTDKNIYKVSGEPYQTDEGVWGIECDPVDLCLRYK